MVKKKKQTRPVKKSKRQAKKIARKTAHGKAKKISKRASHKSTKKSAGPKKRRRRADGTEAIYEEEWASNWDDDAADFSEEE